MKIAIKTQTARSTNWKEGFNCVNLHLQDHFSNSVFQVGLQVTEWGDNKHIEPIVVFEINGKEYRYSVTDLTELLTGQATK